MIETYKANKDCLNLQALKNRGVSNNTLVILVAKLLDDLQNSIGAKNLMNTEMLMLTAGDIVEEFWSLNLADFAYVFRQARMGGYGKLYERLNEATIMGWLDEYRERKMLDGEKASIEKAQVRKEAGIDLTYKLATGQMQSETTKSSPAPQLQTNIADERQRQMTQFNEMYGKKE